jgi:LuxR family maltose regulon positive regulatory protein
VWLAQGKLTAASSWAANTIGSLATWDPLRIWEVLLVVRVALAEHQYAQAIELLEQFRAGLDQSEDIEKRLEWMALHLVALYHAGKRTDAVHVAEHLLALTEPEGYVRLYLDAGERMRHTLVALQGGLGKRGVAARPAKENTAATSSISTSYVLNLLSEFDQDGRHHNRKAGMLLVRRHEVQHGPETAEPLSPQEQRVLQLLVAGQTYAEIADALIVSTNTVKTQVSSIYRKLGVSRRAEAIAVMARRHLL